MVVVVVVVVGGGGGLLVVVDCWLLVVVVGCLNTVFDDFYFLVLVCMTINKKCQNATVSCAYIFMILIEGDGIQIAII